MGQLFLSVTLLSKTNLCSCCLRNECEVWQQRMFRTKLVGRYSEKHDRRANIRNKSSEIHLFKQFQSELKSWADWKTNIAVSIDLLLAWQKSNCTLSMFLSMFAGLAWLCLPISLPCQFKNVTMDHVFLNTLYMEQFIASIHGDRGKHCSDMGLSIIRMDKDNSCWFEYI